MFGIILAIEMKTLQNVNTTKYNIAPYSHNRDSIRTIWLDDGIRVLILAENTESKLRYQLKAEQEKLN